MKSLRLVAACGLVCAGSATAIAQSAPATVARYDGSPELTRVVANAVSNNPNSAYGFCQAVANRGQVTQVYVGAGLAAAYTEFMSVEDRASAQAVTNVACGCGVDVSASFSNSVGVPLGDICSTSWSGDYAGVKPYLWRLLATGGGNGVSRN